MLAYANPQYIDLKEIAFEPLQIFLTKESIPLAQWPAFTEISANELPAPSDYLLTQPLLTKAIADHYQGKPAIEPPLQVEDDIAHQRYYRAVLVGVNNVIVELGLIVINASALPDALMEKVRYSSTPFGALLQEFNIKTNSMDTRQFKTTCTQALTRFLRCEEGKILYGRTNTIVREDTHIPVAHVVEILTGV